jgi:tRNA A37 N6-isopentenylltransferase MiaA
MTVDRNGLGLILFGKDQWHRALILMALALAYDRQMQTFSKETFKAITDRKNKNKLLAQLYGDILHFNAGYYSRLPVKTINHELTQVWKHIHEHWQLEESNKELTQQLQSVGELVSAQLEKSQEKRLKRIEIGLWILAPLLGILGVG